MISGILLGSVLNRFKAFFIIRTNSPHQPVPEQEIQTIIPFEILVVHIMVHRSIDPFAQPVFTESLWIQFPAQVPVHIINDHEQEKENQVIEMNRNAKYKNEEDAGFQDRFQRMEGVGGKGAGIGGLVMHQVDQFKNTGMMNGPVHPVKIGIMNNRHDGEGQNKPDHAVLMDISIKTGVFGKRRAANHDGGNKGHDEYCENGETDFSCIIQQSWKFLLDLFPGDLLFQQHIKQ